VKIQSKFVCVALVETFEDVYEFECYDTCIWFNITTNVIVSMMMHVVYRNELELLRKTVANDGQPQTENDQEKAAGERLLTGL
jgi:hypothetical protein